MPQKEPRDKVKPLLAEIEALSDSYDLEPTQADFDKESLLWDQVYQIVKEFFKLKLYLRGRFAKLEGGAMEVLNKRDRDYLSIEFYYKLCGDIIYVEESIYIDQLTRHDLGALQDRCSLYTDGPVYHYTKLEEEAYKKFKEITNKYRWEVVSEDLWKVCTGKKKL